MAARISDVANFKRLAVKRTNNAIKYIRLIGNLSNKSNYSYSPSDVKKIFDAIEDELTECLNRFADAAKKEKGKFSLD